MSNLTFRPRPIDVDKKIPIFRNEEIDAIAHELEASGISRSVIEMPTGMEAEEEEEAHIQEAIKRSLTISKSSIPTPTVKVVDGWDAENVMAWNRPKTYVLYKELTRDEEDECIWYDLDNQDERFLGTINTNGKKLLQDDKFEELIDRFEKESAKIDGEVPSFVQLEKMIRGVKQNISLSVYNYWVKRREENNNLALMPRYLKPPDPNDPDPYKAFRVRVEEKTLKKKGRKNDQSALMKMKQLRQEMERARTLLEMIKKRERLKQSYIGTLYEVFEYQCLDIRSMGPVSNKKRKDFKGEQQEKAKRKRIVKKGFAFDDVSDSEISDDLSASSSEYSPSDSPSPRPQLELGRDIEESEAQATAEPSLQQIYRETGAIHLGGNMPPFRGRCRVGRGGRVVFDRRPAVPHNHNNGNGNGSGVIHEWLTDEEYNPKLSSLSELIAGGYHPFTVGNTDADRLLKKLLIMQGEEPG